MEQESARSIIEKLVRIWKITLTARNVVESDFVQVDRGAKLSKKNNFHFHTFNLTLLHFQFHTFRKIKLLFHPGGKGSPVVEEEQQSENST